MNPYRVLIIDPDPTSTTFLGHEFKKAGFEIHVANSTKEGLILAYQHRPHVIIIDPVQKNVDYLDLLSKFRKDWRLARTKVFAFSSLRNPAEIQRSIDLGFDEYLAKEGHAVNKLISLANAAGQYARNPAASQAKAEPDTGAPQVAPKAESKLGKTIIFLSAKGGIGTSSLCTNIAHIVNSKQDQEITVVDLVLPIGSLEAIVGTHDSVNIVEVSKMASETAISDFLQESLVEPENWNFKFLAGSRSPEESEELDITRTPQILEAVRKQSDYVFVDLGKSLSRISMPAILSADLIVLTLSLDQMTVEQTKAVWEFLKKKGVTKQQVYFLINRAVGLEGLPKSEVEEILGTTIQLAVPYMGNDFTLANNLNQPIADKFPQDAVTISLRQASDEMFRKIELRTQKTEYF